MPVADSGRMDSSDYQAGRNGNLTPPDGDWSDFQRGMGDQQQWQANNDSIRTNHPSTDDERGAGGEGTRTPGAIRWLGVLWSLLKLVAVAWIAYKLFFG